MLRENVEKIQSLNPFQTELLKEIFIDPQFNLREYGDNLNVPEQTVRWNLSQVYIKLGVPDSIPNNQKREWVVSEYQDDYDYVFHRETWEDKQASQRLTSQPEIYISPPNPVMAEHEPDQPAEIAPSEPVRDLEKELEEAIERLEKLRKDTLIVDREFFDWLSRPRHRTVRLWVFFLFVFLAFVIGFYFGIVINN